MENDSRCTCRNYTMDSEIYCPVHTTTEDYIQKHAAAMNYLASLEDKADGAFVETCRIVKHEKDMEESLKYYIPSIEDIRVGYECELFWNQDHLSKNFWDKIIVGEVGLEDMNWYARIAEKTIRTPYLTKEQIEAEGWEEYPKWIEATDTKYYIKGDLTLNVYSDRRIEIIIPKSSNTYWGNCPSINEFRFINKLLGV